MRTLLLLGLILASTTSSALAQMTIIPIRYRVTRTADGQPTIQHVFLKSAMQCDLPSANPVAGSLRIEDPLRPGSDCQWVDSVGTIFANRVPGLTYTYTIAGQANDTDPYSPESVAVTVRMPAIPPAPTNPRVTPPGTVAFAGTVIDRYPFAGLDVAEVSLDIGLPFYFGAPYPLQSGDYSVQRGDRFIFELARPPH